MIAATHLGFFETMAGVIPVVFLALVVEERRAPDAEGFFDYFLPVLAAALLFIGEAFALKAVYVGHGTAGVATGIAVSAAAAALILFGDATVARAEEIKDTKLHRRVITASLVMLAVVVVAVFSIAASTR